ncbi:MAG: LysE family translocator [Gammaproteobacteria bacterium]|nr:LysE family translocator [Gammaproteobacteria bacterium]
MSSELLMTFLLFAFVSSITPGPNNIMLLSSGVNFGFRRTIPHMSGVSLGFSAMVLVVGVGLGAVFMHYPVMYTALRYISALYLIYLAGKIAFSGAPMKSNVTAKPITFWQAVAFQWVNPKAWLMSVAAIAAYAPEQHFTSSIIFISIIFILFVAPCSILWTAMGHWIKQFFSHSWHLRAFNIVMAGLLLLSLYPLFSEAVI